MAAMGFNKTTKTRTVPWNWEDISLAHDFHEVEYLPENDRLRFTISPDARKGILKRLLLLNHQIHEQELEQNQTHPSPKTRDVKNKTPFQAPSSL